MTIWFQQNMEFIFIIMMEKLNLIDILVNYLTLLWLHFSLQKYPSAWKSEAALWPEEPSKSQDQDPGVCQVHNAWWLPLPIINRW